MISSSFVLAFVLLSADSMRFFGKSDNQAHDGILLGEGPTERGRAGEPSLWNEAGAVVAGGFVGRAAEVEEIGQHAGENIIGDDEEVGETVGVVAAISVA